MFTFWSEWNYTVVHCNYIVLQSCSLFDRNEISLDVTAWYWRIRQPLIHSVHELERERVYKLWEALLKISCVMSPRNNGVRSVTGLRRVSYISREFPGFITGMVSGRRWSSTGMSRWQSVVSILHIARCWQENCGTSGVSADSLRRRYRKVQNANHIRGHDANKTLS